MAIKTTLVKIFRPIIGYDKWYKSRGFWGVFFILGTVGSILNIIEGEDVSVITVPIFLLIGALLLWLHVKRIKQSSAQDKETNELLLNAFNGDFGLCFKSGVASAMRKSDFEEEMIDSCCNISLLQTYVNEKYPDADHKDINKVPSDLAEAFNAVKKKLGPPPYKEGPLMREWRKLSYQIWAINTISLILPAINQRLIDEVSSSTCRDDDFDCQNEKYMFVQEAKKALAQR